MKKTLAMVLVLSAASPVSAADLLPGGSACQISGGSQLMNIADNAALEGEVVRMMTEAVNVADDSSQWASSRSPAFTWASEAKVACGKAFGYLQNEYRDEQYLDKCECFHQRMVSYMY